MKLAEEIKIRMDSVYRYFDIENGVRFNTHCLYPSNGFVQVSVYGGGSEFYVTDAGGAFREAEAAGATIKHPDRQFSKLLKKQGLSIRQGAIYSPNVSLDSLPAAITIVANTSKEMADTIFETWRLERTRNFKEMVREFLKSQFVGSEVKEEKISGSSNKPHTFDNVVKFLNGSTLIIDPVLKDANSINSRVVANMDVHAKNYPNLRQSIVYDDTEEWQSSDLNLLGVTQVPVFAFSKSEAALKAIVRI